MPRIHTSDLEDDIPFFLESRLDKAQWNCVFDVGANVGWYTYQVLKAMKDAHVWCFEPIPSTFEVLQKNVERFGGSPRVVLVPHALGSSRGTARMTATPGVTVNKITSTDSEETVAIEVLKGDEYCAENSIDHINLLKIDAEGHDLHVLLGFINMISAGKIDIIQVEAGFSPENLNHIPIEHYRGLLEAFGFVLLTIKNQASNLLPRLTWADVVFIRKAYAEAIA